MGRPKLLYSVDTPAWLSEIQKGLVAEKDIPQGLTRLGSVLKASPGTSETSFSSATRCARAGRARDAASAVAASPITKEPLRPNLSKVVMVNSSFFQTPWQTGRTRRSITAKALIL